MHGCTSDVSGRSSGDLGCGSVCVGSGMWELAEPRNRGFRFLLARQFGSQLLTRDIAV
jgi:hypothetical protein